MAVEKISKGEIAFKQISVMGAKTLQIVNSKLALTDINRKSAVYKQIYLLLEKAVQLYFSQNINTFSNRLYFDILREQVVQTKAGYAELKGKVLQHYQGDSKYRYRISKINELINETEELAQKFKKNKDAAFGKLMVENLKLIQENVKLRPLNVRTIDLLPAIEKARKAALRTKHVEAIYSEIIVPLMNYLVKENALEADKADKIKKHLLSIAKHGYIVDPEKQFNAKISVKYWPKEIVLNDAEKFGYRGNIGLQFTETLSQGRVITTDFESSGDYISNFKLAVQAYNKGEKTAVGGKKIFYAYLLQRVKSDNKELFGKLKVLLDKLADRLYKEGAKEEDVATMKESAKEIGEVVETFYGSTYIFNIKRVKGEKTSHLRLSIEETKQEAPQYEAPKTKKVKPVVEKKLPKGLEDL